jgi:hypothetical protein
MDPAVLLGSREGLESNRSIGISTAVRAHPMSALLAEVAFIFLIVAANVAFAMAGLAVVSARKPRLKQ